MVNKAVLCGINKYKTQTELRGCLNDITKISTLLTQYFDFHPDNIHSLKDDQVTKTAVQDEYSWLIANTVPGDRLVFHFSGHGSYVPDEQGEETDGKDEILCLYDMDFHDPNTYIQDDEWNAMIERVPEDVDLTFIFDSCHSGTATRGLNVNVDGHSQRLLLDLKTAREHGVSVEDQLSRSAMASDRLNPGEYHDVLRNKSVILPRFIAPPAEFQENVLTIARRLQGQRPRTVVTKHLLFASAQEDQTAADAYIENNFYGAFTYYLCQTLTENPTLCSQSIIDSVHTRLKNNQYSQIPQHFGEGRSHFLFNSENTKTVTHLGSTNTQTTSSLTPDNQKRLIEAYMKLLDTLRGEVVSGVEVQDITARRTSNRYLVYVHGISNHLRNYSKPWWDALKPFVGNIFGDGVLGQARQEVLWSDLVNQQARSLTPSPDRLQLQRDIELILEERRQQMIARETGGGLAARQAQPLQIERGSGLAVDDFLIYMTNAEMRQRIIDRFTSVVKPLLSNGNHIDIICHSWGTVVTYEGLRELEQQTSTGRVKNLFTVGSALSISPVRWALRPNNQNGRRPNMVDHWINLDARGDLVGGVLGNHFEVDQEYLELVPTGCSVFAGLYNPGCAHGSYFNRQNITTNQDIFARYILAT